MNRLIIIFSVLVIIFSSCKDPFGVEENVRITPIIKKKMLDLSNLEIGQTARFTFFEIKTGSYLAESSKTLHESDTLVMEVYGRDASGWLFREYLLEHSKAIDSIVTTDKNINPKENTLRYSVNIINNEFIAGMPNNSEFNSYFFKSTSQVKFSLEDYYDTLVTLNYWESPFALSQRYDKGYIAGFGHREKEYTRINILQIGNINVDIFDKVPLQLLIFSKKNGFVQKILFYSDNTNRSTIGYGWDLVHD